jgi:integration host factor subunit beta
MMSGAALLAGRGSPAGRHSPHAVLRQGEQTVTKKDIVKQIADELGLSQLKTKAIVQRTLQAIIDIVVQEQRLELRNFGVFEVKQRPARPARNPRTGVRVWVPPRCVVTFKAGKELEARLRRLLESGQLSPPRRTRRRKSAAEPLLAEQPAATS